MCTVLLEELSADICLCLLMPPLRDRDLCLEMAETSESVEPEGKTLSQ